MGITFFSTFVVVTVMLHNIWTYRPIWEFFIIVYLVSWLDCLDGDVARACGNGSPIGPTLDTFADFYAGVAGFATVVAVSQRPKWFFGPVVLYLLGVTYTGFSCAHHA